MKVYFLRHGESQGNATGDYSTEAHDSLSPKGRDQARNLVPRLSETEFDAVYSSPLLRAVQTITPWAIETRRKIEIWPDLAESCWQPDRTISPEEKIPYVPSTVITDETKEYFFFKDNCEVQPSGDETYSQGIYRLRKTADSLLSLHSGTETSILIVSHGFTIARLMELLLCIEPHGRFHHSNTGISLLREEENRFFVCYTNRLQ